MHLTLYQVFPYFHSFSTFFSILYLNNTLFYCEDPENFSTPDLLLLKENTEAKVLSEKPLNLLWQFSFLFFLGCGFFS